MPAVGTTTISYNGTRPKKITFAWTSDAAGVVSGTPSTTVRGEIVRAVFVPGSGGTQPTNLYDVTLLDGAGVDVLAGLGANLSNAAATQKCPLIGDATNVLQRNHVNDTLELQVANAGNAKTGVVYLYVQ